jgi:hypothetical protein
MSASKLDLIMKPKHNPTVENHRQKNSRPCPSNPIAKPTLGRPTSYGSYPRYPSLCDDHQPWFPLWPRDSPSLDASKVTSEAGYRRFCQVRIAALIAIVAIVAFLVAGL